jgi:glycopeptide antibiotics resistance protein
VQHHGHSGGFSASRVRAAGVLLLAAYCAFVGWLTLRPRSVPWVPPPNFEPFATIRAELADGPVTALTGIGGGLLLLAPLGVLLPLAAGRLHRPLPRTALRTVPAGVLLACALALAQSGIPGHVIDVDTVLLNAAGCTLAHLLLYPPLRARLRVSLRGSQAPGEEKAEPGTRRSTRVGIAP